MKRQLNYDLLLFHVREASQELDGLFLRIKKKLGELEEPLSEEDKAILHVYDRPLEESGLKVSLEHAYHHLNFAWNVRYKNTENADRHFDRDEKFPKRSRGSGRNPSSRNGVDEGREQPFRKRLNKEIDNNVFPQNDR